jgi:ribosomal protein S20
LSVSKYRNKLSLTKLKEEKISQRNQQEEENQFYRSCFKNFRQLVITAIEASAVETTQDLSLQSHFEPKQGNTNLKLVIDKLRVALENFWVQEAYAERDWKSKWKVSRFWNPAPR